MEKEFIPYNEALELKELGFDEPCLAYHNNHEPKNNHPRGLVVSGNQDHNIETEGDNLICSAPLYQQAFRWFREKYGIKHFIADFIDDKTGIEWDYEIVIIGTDLDEIGNYKPLVDYSTDDETRKFKSYEEAELACLIKLIEIVKEKK